MESEDLFDDDEPIDFEEVNPHEEDHEENDGQYKSWDDVDAASNNSDDEEYEFLLTPLPEIDENRRDEYLEIMEEEVKKLRRNAEVKMGNFAEESLVDNQGANDKDSWERAEEVCMELMGNSSMEDSHIFTAEEMEERFGSFLLPPEPQPNKKQPLPEPMRDSLGVKIKKLVLKLLRRS